MAGPPLQKTAKVGQPRTYYVHSGGKHMVHTPLAKFRAVYCSGAFIPDADAVVALSLLFEKVHLPNNIEIIRSFVTKYRLSASPSARIRSIKVRSEEGEDPFSDLTIEQQDTARLYLAWAMQFAYAYSELFGIVLESELFPDNRIVSTELVKKGGPGERNTYRISFSQEAELRGGDEEYFLKLIESGYVPVVGRFHVSSPMCEYQDRATAKQLAALLAMESVKMVLPRTKSARPEVILEARDRLRDQLPPFWSSMLKASVELKKLIGASDTHREIAREARDVVDRTIRPAVIDLAARLEKDRKDWFYKILSPVRSGLRLFVGNPPVTQQQLLTTALVLASDTCVSIAENIHTIESLKREAGLTYLLDLSEMFASDPVGS